MYKKNDPLVQSVQKIMEENERRRQVEAKLCEELGIYSRKELPHEHQKNYDALLEQRISEALHPNQQKLDVHEPEKDKLTAQDFKMLRAKKKTMEEEDKKEKPISKKIDKEKEAYSKMRQELVGKGTDRKTTEKLVSEEEGEETREGGAVVDTKTNKPVVSATASRAEGPSPAERAALTNKIKQMKEAMLAAPETGPRKTPGSNEMNEEQLDEKAVSKAQHRFFGLVRAIQKGKAEGSEKAEKAAKEMSATEVRKFAKTKEKSLPEKKSEMKESHTLDSVMEEIKKKLGEDAMNALYVQEAAVRPANQAAPSRVSDPTVASRATQVARTPSASPQSRPTPAQLGVRNPRMGVNQAIGTTAATGPKAGEVPSPVSRENNMPTNKAAGTAFRPQAVATVAANNQRQNLAKASERDDADTAENSALGQSQNKQPTPKPATPAPTPAPTAKPVTAAPSMTSPQAQQAYTSARKAEADTPASGASNAGPATRPTPRPAAATATPAAKPAAAPETPKSSAWDKYNASQYSGDSMGGGSAAEFARADKAMRNMQESLETTIRNVLKD